MNPRHYTVKSFTKENKTYDVWFFPKGNIWKCNCFAYAIRKKGANSCKHILKAKTSYTNLIKKIKEKQEANSRR